MRESLFYYCWTETMINNSANSFNLEAQTNMFLQDWSDPSVPPAAAGRSVTSVGGLPVVCPAGGAAATIPRSETPSWPRARLPPPPASSSSVPPDDSCPPLPALPARVSGGSRRFYKDGRRSVAVSASSSCCPPETLGRFMR